MLTSPPRGRLLLVEDDPFLLRLCETVLAPVCELVIAHDGQEAFERVQNGERFDSVVCDMFMPRKGGIQFFKEAVAAAPELASRFIFMTGGSDASIEAFLDSVPNPVLRKPFPLNDLSQTVARVHGENTMEEPQRMAS